MQVRDYYIVLENEPLEKRLKLRTVLNKHGTEYYCDLRPQAEMPVCEFPYLICYSGNAWIASSTPLFNKTQISLDNFLLKFHEPLQTKRRQYDNH
jgi:hypothetical protein